MKNSVNELFEVGENIKKIRTLRSNLKGNAFNAYDHLLDELIEADYFNTKKQQIRFDQINIKKKEEEKTFTLQYKISLNEKTYYIEMDNNDFRIGTGDNTFLSTTHIQREITLVDPIFAESEHKEKIKELHKKNLFTLKTILDDIKDRKDSGTYSNVNDNSLAIEFDTENASIGIRENGMVRINLVRKPAERGVFHYTTTDTNTIDAMMINETFYNLKLDWHNKVNK